MKLPIKRRFDEGSLFSASLAPCHMRTSKSGNCAKEDFFVKVFCFTLPSKILSLSVSDGFLSKIISVLLPPRIVKNRRQVEKKCFR